MPLDGFRPAPDVSVVVVVVLVVFVFAVDDDSRTARKRMRTRDHSVRAQLEDAGKATVLSSFRDSFVATDAAMERGRGLALVE